VLDAHVLVLELIQTQMAQKPMLRAEVSYFTSDIRGSGIVLVVFFLFRNVLVRVEI